MRISDWSSDVCSSDLAGSPQTRSRKGKAGRAQFSSAIGNGSDVAGCGKQAGWQEDGGRAMTEIRIDDTTLRDGHQCLWATRMSTAMMLPVVERMDRIGFEAEIGRAPV